MHVTPFYAALLGLLFLLLSVRTFRLRHKLRIAIGVSVGGRDNEQMLRAVRVHANFSEYAPLTLLLIFMFELLGGSIFFVHVLAISLLIGRAVHAFGVSKVQENYRFRTIGMALTLFSLLFASLGMMYLYAIR